MCLDTLQSKEKRELSHSVKKRSTHSQVILDYQPTQKNPYSVLINKEGVIIWGKEVF